MPIYCNECSSEMTPNLREDYIECTNPKCPRWTRQCSLVYEYALNLEARIYALEDSIITMSRERGVFVYRPDSAAAMVKPMTDEILEKYRSMKCTAFFRKIFDDLIIEIDRSRQQSKETVCKLSEKVEELKTALAEVEE